MSYNTQEGYYTVGELGEGESFVTKYKWYLVAAAVAAAAGGFYYYKKNKLAKSMYGLGLDDVGCGCE